MRLGAGDGAARSGGRDDVGVAEATTAQNHQSTVLTLSVAYHLTARLTGLPYTWTGHRLICPTSTSAGPVLGLTLVGIGFLFPRISRLQPPQLRYTLTPCTSTHTRPHPPPYPTPHLAQLRWK